MKKLLPLFLVSLLLSCNSNENKEKPQETPELKTEIEEVEAPIENVSLIVLGTVQDAGSPQIGCKKECCVGLFEHPDETRKVVALGLVDPENKTKYLFDATPDITSQLKRLSRFGFDNSKELPDGIFLTHAHIGHYTGLMYLGREATNAPQVPIYAMPSMKKFLTENGPWSQLVANKNIVIEDLNHEAELKLTSNVKVIPFTVPHRDEFSETVGYKIIGPRKSVLFIPDIDKWNKWEKDIVEEIKSVDYAFIDATFFDAAEINNRDISEIPHPFIIESMNLFKDLNDNEKDKIYFIHLNHTNKALNIKSAEAQRILTNGFHLAQYNDVFEL